MKDDRDKNFQQKNDAGATVNRWTSVAFLAASASSNETGHIYGKFIRSLGAIAADNQARL
jgi:formate dehydrogenase major subunit